MRVICIGDIHGRTIWKNIINQEKNADLIIFLGDYFDTKNSVYSGMHQINNFKEILSLKEENNKKFIILIGNHELHYIRGVGETYGGFQPLYSRLIGEEVEKAINKGLLQVCYYDGQYFYSHAGLTKTWLKRTIVPNNINPLVNDELVTLINDYLVYRPSIFGFMMGENYSKTGNDITQGPLWVRPNSLINDMVEEIICVVGHTKMDNIIINHENRIILIDCLEEFQFLSIQDGIPKMEEIKF